MSPVLKLRFFGHKGNDYPLNKKIHDVLFCLSQGYFCSILFVIFVAEMKKEQKTTSPLEFFQPAEKERDKLPLFADLVSAGFPSPADDYIDKKLDLNELLIKHPAATFYVRVSGDSMIDANIFDGDILVIDKSQQAKSGNIVIAALNGEFTVKRLDITVDGISRLVPENPAFKPVVLHESDDFSVFGVVTHVIHKV